MLMVNGEICDEGCGKNEGEDEVWGFYGGWCLEKKVEG